MSGQVDRDLVRKIFREALDAEPAELPALLEAACGGDADLRHEVESLLAAHREAGSFLEPLETSGPSDRAPAQAPTEPVRGQQIGLWEIGELIGRGGMGSVYAALRAGVDYRQEAALKILHPGKATRDLEERFRRERRILASLDHPSIARLLDGGATDDGRAYLVMERVDGSPIDWYCDRHRLSVEERIRLFLGVCHAVHYAHQHLVVHRDLKPSNILVQEDGAVKLVDFGIAKPLAVEAGEPTGDAFLTRTGLTPMTLAYASPEQVRGDPITTATDVYALGILLFELLTGQPPFATSGSSPVEIIHAISEADPGRLSEVVGDAAASAGLRRTTPQRLRRRLAGDLEAVVARALRKEPRLRYGSARELAADLEAHLEGRPVTARRGDFTYRLGKFVRRHRWPVASAAALLLGSLAFAAVMAVQRAKIARERDRAQAVTRFVVDLFEQSDPMAETAASRGERMTVRDLLDGGAVRLESELHRQPELRAPLLATAGRIYLRLARFERAASYLEEALALRREQLGPGHPEVAESLHDLAALRHEQGDSAAAAELLEQALAIRRERLGPRSSEVASSLALLAAVRSSAGEVAAAEELLGEALAIEQEDRGSSRLAAKIVNDLGLLARSRGEYRQAAERLGEALERRRRLLGPVHPEVAESLNDLGSVYLEQGHYDQAEPLFRQALSTYRQIFGDDHPWVAVSLNNVATTLYFQGRLDEAEPLFDESFSLHRELLGDDHPRLAVILGNLAGVARARQGGEEAEALLRRALAIRRRSLAADHPDVAENLTQLAVVLRSLGRGSEALSLLEEAVATQRRVLGDRHPALANSLFHLARSVEAAGDVGRAGRLAREAADILAGALPPGDWRLLQVRSYVGACLTAEGRYAEAEEVLTATYEALAAAPGADHAATRQTVDRLIRLYEAWGRPEEAARWRDRASRESSPSEPSRHTPLRAPP